MLNINVFSKYKVLRKYRGSSYAPTYDDRDNFEDYKGQNNRILTGSELMKWIADDLKNNDTLYVSFNDTEIYFEQYKPNGSCCDINYIIKEQSDVE